MFEEYFGKISAFYRRNKWNFCYVTFRKNTAFSFSDFGEILATQGGPLRHFFLFSTKSTKKIKIRKNNAFK